MVQEEHGVGGEATPLPADGAASEHGLGRKVDEDLLQDIFGEVGESVRACPASSSRHGRPSGFLVGGNADAQPGSEQHLWGFR